MCTCGGGASVKQAGDIQDWGVLCGVGRSVRRREQAVCDHIHSEALAGRALVNDARGQSSQRVPMAQTWCWRVGLSR